MDSFGLYETLFCTPWLIYTENVAIILPMEEFVLSSSLCWSLFPSFSLMKWWIIRMTIIPYFTIWQWYFCIFGPRKIYSWWITSFLQYIPLYIRPTPPFIPLYIPQTPNTTIYYHIYTMTNLSIPNTWNLEFSYTNYIMFFNSEDCIQLELIFNFNVQWKFKFNFNASDLKNFH